MAGNAETETECTCPEPASRSRNRCAAIPGSTSWATTNSTTITTTRPPSAAIRRTSASAPLGQQRARRGHGLIHQPSHVEGGLTHAADHHAIGEDEKEVGHIVGTAAKLEQAGGAP